jgi:hypothetical protein
MAFDVYVLSLRSHSMVFLFLEAATADEKTVGVDTDSTADG